MRGKLLGRSPMIFFAWLLSAALAPALAAPQTLKFYTWPDYIDPAVVAEFEQRFDAKIDSHYFESDEERDQRLAANAGRGYDVIMLNGLQLPRYGQRGWLERIDVAAVPNWRHIEPRWQETLSPDARDYGVPYFWGTLGIAYRKDLVPAGFASWRDLLQPAEGLRGKIVMNHFARELVAFGLKALGHSANASDPALLNRAGELLLDQRPFVMTYGYPVLNERSALVQGTVWAVPMYNGDALALQRYHSDIAYVIPREGGLLWIDYLTVAQVSQRKALAFAFINFLHEPQINARLARYLYYASPNRAAAAYLPAAFFANSVIYPTAEQLAQSEFLAPLPARSQKIVNTIGVRLFYQ